MTAQADRVQKLVDSPELKDAFIVVREKLRDMIESTPLSDDGALLDVRKMLHLLRDVEEALHTAIETGHLEDFRVNEQVERDNIQDISIWNRVRKKSQKLK